MRNYYNLSYDKAIQHLRLFHRDNILIRRSCWEENKYIRIVSNATTIIKNQEIFILDFFIITVKMASVIYIPTEEDKNSFDWAIEEYSFDWK